MVTFLFISTVLSWIELLTAWEGIWFRLCRRTGVSCGNFPVLIMSSNQDTMYNKYIKKKRNACVHTHTHKGRTFSQYVVEYKDHTVEVNMFFYFRSCVTHQGQTCPRAESLRQGEKEGDLTSRVNPSVSVGTGGMSGRRGAGLKREGGDSGEP